LIIKELKITNASGDSITFGRHFRLYEDIDLSALKADVSYSESSSDGASYQRTRLDVRDFNVPFFIYRTIEGYQWFEERRREAYRVFNPKKNPMRVDFTTKAGERYYINAELTASPDFPIEFENSNNVWQKALLQFSCHDPYVYKTDINVVQIATWVPSFEFSFEIPNEGVEMGYRSPSLIANVFNDGQESTGMMIKFKALGSLSTPSLVNVNTYEEFKLNMDLEGGDVVEVSTYKGKKYARLTRNNVTTSVFGKVDLSSTFLQLETGDNLFRYDAAEGLDNLDVSMYFTSKLLGV
jgi:Phage tail protein